MQLRYYQSDAVNACWDWIKTKEGNPCIVIPTGGGKSLVMATIAKQVVEWGSRCLILAHVKELVDQNAEELNQLAPSVDVGIYSAGLKERNNTAQVVSAGIQSVYKKADELFAEDVPPIVMVDECHLISPDGDGMYQTFLSDLKSMNPDLRVIGLTATPYRTGQGMVVGEGKFLDEICYEVGVAELISAGYLSSLKSKTVQQLNTDSLHIRRGEFVSDEAEALMMAHVESAVGEMLTLTTSRQSVLLFGQSLKHCWAICDLLDSAGVPHAMVDGSTGASARSELLDSFKSGELKYLVNCNVLTTGFNARGVDCVALMRPTVSPGLYYQMVGRGFRLSPETKKENCLVLDYGNNIKRHGPVDALRVPVESKSKVDAEPITKTCPECKAEIWIAAGICPDCGYEFTPDTPPAHEGAASSEAILSEQQKPDEYTVHSVEYSIHEKRNAAADAPKSMRVDYLCGYGKAFSEWICVEHEGFARQKAKKWWQQRITAECPNDAEKAVAVAQEYMPSPETISVIKDGRFERVTEWDFGETHLPAQVIVNADDLVRQPGEDNWVPEDEWTPALSDDEVPF